jgi:ABC-type lipoprotein release transport system permease subunit
VRSAIGGVNQDIALVFRSFETQVTESMLQPRVVASLSTAFAAYLPARRAARLDPMSALHDE